MLIDKLREYLKNTPDEQLVKEWNELDDWTEVGLTAEELVEYWKILYSDV